MNFLFVLVIPITNRGAGFVWNELFTNIFVCKSLSRRVISPITVGT